MELDCDGPRSPARLIVLTLLFRNIYTLADSKKTSKPLILNIFTEVVEGLLFLFVL